MAPYAAACCSVTSMDLGFKPNPATFLYSAHIWVPTMFQEMNCLVILGRQLFWTSFFSSGKLKVTHLIGDVSNMKWNKYDVNHIFKTSALCVSLQCTRTLSFHPDLLSDKIGQPWPTLGLGQWTGTPLVVSSAKLSARHPALPPAGAENTMEVETASNKPDLAWSGPVSWGKWKPFST